MKILLFLWFISGVVFTYGYVMGRNAGDQTFWWDVFNVASWLVASLFALWLNYKVRVRRERRVEREQWEGSEDSYRWKPNG